MSPFLKIIRFPNLVIVLITQYLLRFCVIDTWYAYSGNEAVFSHVDFALLVFSTLLIAAGGNIINDIFDLDTDQINKPEKILLGKSIPMLTAKVIYLSLSISGILIGLFLAYKLKSIQLGLIFPVIAIMLFLYSKTYQKVFLLGNIIISFLTAMVIIIVWLFEFFSLSSQPTVFSEVQYSLHTISYIFFAYAVFAFVITLLREILKDAEDREGDFESGYQTIIIVWGLQISKIVIIAVILIGMGLLAFAQYWLLNHGFQLVLWYLVIIQLFFIYVMYFTFIAKNKKDFHSLSNAVKIIMLAGILSMQLFCI